MFVDLQTCAAMCERDEDEQIYEQANGDNRDVNAVDSAGDNSVMTGGCCMCMGTV
jgi:hypothetical protein